MDATNRRAPPSPSSALNTGLNTGLNPGEKSTTVGNVIVFDKCTVRAGGPGSGPCQLQNTHALMSALKLAGATGKATQLLRLGSAGTSPHHHDVGTRSFDFAASITGRSHAERDVTAEAQFQCARPASTYEVVLGSAAANLSRHCLRRRMQVSDVSDRVEMNVITVA